MGIHLLANSSLAAALNPAQSGSFNLIELLLTASGTVRAVLFMLVCLSIIGWYVIGSKWFYLSKAQNESISCLDEFWAAKRLDAVYQTAENYKRSPIAQMFKNAYVVPVTGGESRAVSFLANGGSDTISWSPDGTYLIFDSGQRTENGHAHEERISPDVGNQDVRRDDPQEEPRRLQSRLDQDQHRRGIHHLATLTRCRGQLNHLIIQQQPCENLA